MIPFILIPLSVGMGLVGLGAFLWALANHQFDDPDDAASRVLFANLRADRPSDRKGYDHGQLASDPDHGDADGRL